MFTHSLISCAPVRAASALLVSVSVFRLCLFVLSCVVFVCAWSSLSCCCLRFVTLSTISVSEPAFNISNYFSHCACYTRWPGDASMITCKSFVTSLAPTIFEQMPYSFSGALRALEDAIAKQSKVRPLRAL
jgi:hypothetical protein